MEITRKFLGYDEPLLQSAARYLVENFGFNLFPLRVAVTSRRAGRRLIEILVSQSEQAQELLVPPRAVFSLGELPEQFYTPTSDFASSVDRLVGWKKALEQSEAQWLTALSKGSEKLSNSNLVHLANRLDSIWSELSAAGLTFKEVADKVESFIPFEENQRWLAFDSVFNSYLELLKQASLADKNNARLEALGSTGSLKSSGTLILLGTAELSNLSKLFLSQASGEGIALIQAPQEENEAFDQFGTVLTSSWLRKQTPVEDSQIYIAQRSSDQPLSALSFLSSDVSGQSLEDITIGITDQNLKNVTIESFNVANCAIRSAEGIALIDSAPYKLLAGMINYSSFRRVSDLSFLLRHGDYSRFITKSLATGLAPSRYIAMLDKFIEQHLAQDIYTILELDRDGELSKIVKLTDQLLAELKVKTRSVEQWIIAISSILDTIYNLVQSEKTSDNEPCMQLAQTLADVRSIKILTSGEECDLFFLMQLISKVAESKTIPNEGADIAAELLGWLELALDDAPYLFVIGFNEGNVPEALNSDPFLPNNLRQELGLSNNDTRYARDMYIFTALAHSRKKFCVSYARRSDEGELLLPSRLLLATDQETRAKKILQFCGAVPAENRASAELSIPIFKEQSELGFPKPPDPVDVVLPNSLSVTAYQSYLECPHRFYLRHILKLRRSEGEGVEMSAQLFGSVAHAVLAGFALSTEAKSTDPAKVGATLKELLVEEIRSQFGTKLPPTVSLQKELLEERLLNFATRQSDWCAQGWVVKEVETDFRREDFISDSGKNRLGLHGRIDRIDYNEREDCWAILDYKTGERPQQLKKHYNEVWSSVQLPLYYHLCRERLQQEQLHLGYINLSRDNNSNGFEVGKFSSEQIQSGLELAYQAGRAILAGVFWPPNDKPYPNDEFADICSSGMFDHLLEELEDSDGE